MPTTLVQNSRAFFTIIDWPKAFSAVLDQPTDIPKSSVHTFASNKAAIVYELALLPRSRAHALLRLMADRSDVGADVVSLLRELGLRET